MKAESTDQAPAFNVLEPDGQRGQVHPKEITAVLLNDGRWYQIKYGSFKFYKTGSGVPFVQFKLSGIEFDDSDTGDYLVEVFPATVAGVAYPTFNEDL